MLKIYSYNHLQHVIIQEEFLYDEFLFREYQEIIKSVMNQ